MILGSRKANQEFDVLTWWKANQSEYPILSGIAIDLYAIPGMSAEVEGVFSGFVPRFLKIDFSAKQTITDRRNQLGIDSVKCIECLHHWLSSGIVEGVSTEVDVDESTVIDD